MDAFVAFICLSALLAGSYTDLRTREVSDWQNYALIFTGFAYAAIRSISAGSLSPVLESALGFGVFYLAALAMYYTGQWGGGDSKMIMGLGAAIGIPLTLSELPFLLSFFIYTILFGAVYGLAWSLALALRNRKAFLREYRAINSRHRKTKLLLLAAIALGLFSAFLSEARTLVLLLALLLGLTYYMFIFVRAVEKSCMLRRVRPSRLTEGDWIAEDVYCKGKRLWGPKDLGISKECIARLVALEKQKRIGKVLVKEGVPFVPSFLLAFLGSSFLGFAPFQGILLRFAQL